MSVDCFLPWRLAQWNPTRGVWETGQHDLLSGLSELYSETWPTSGMTRAGVAYELPTPALHMDDSVSSSLPTPRASRGASGTETMYKLGAERSDENRPQGELLLKTPTSQLAVNGGSQHPDKRRSGGHGPTLADEEEHLLPTPAAMNPNDGESVETWEARRVRTKERVKNGNGFGTPLAIAVQLLPTPSAADGLGGHERRGGSRTTELLLAGLAKAQSRGDLMVPLSADGSASSDG